MELPDKVRQDIRKDIRNQTGLGGHVPDDLLTKADWWAGVKTPAIDITAIGHAQRFRHAVYFQRHLHRTRPRKECSLRLRAT